MPLVIFTKNMMTDGGPAKAHTIGRVLTERGSAGWTVQVDHHATQEQAERESGVVWQTYYQMPFDVELGGHPYKAAATWLIGNEPVFAGGEMVVPGTVEQIEEGDE